MTKQERLFQIKENNASILKQKGASLSQIIEVHAAVCMLGSQSGILDTRARAIAEFTSMLIHTENACAEMIAVAQEEDQ